MEYNLILNFELVDIINLQTYLKTDLSLKTKITSLNYESISKKLTLNLSSALDNTDITNLDNLLAVYDNSYIPIYKISNVGFQQMNFSSLEYTTMFVYNYQYSPEYRFHSININTNSTNTTNTDYTIRLLNINTNTIVVSKICNIDNTGVDQDELLIDPETVFEDTQTLEIQMKLNGPGTISLLNINFIYQQLF